MHGKSTAPHINPFVFYCFCGHLEHTSGSIKGQTLYLSVNYLSLITARKGEKVIANNGMKFIMIGTF